MDVLTVVKRNPFVVPMAIVAAPAMVFISEGSCWQSVDELDDQGTMASARTHIKGLTQGILDAETGQRGYLLTGRDEYLQPYESALKEINEALNFLALYYGKEARPKELLAELRSLIESRLSVIKETVRLRKEGKAEAATELVLCGIGKEQMESIRALGAGLLARET